MKNRKNFLIISAFFALLCLGVGYAALTNDLGIGGTATGYGESSSGVVDETLFDIKWDTTVNPTAVPTKPAGSNLTASAKYDGTDAAENNATITIENMSIEGEKVVATFTIKNTSSKDYMAYLTATVKAETSGSDETRLNKTVKFIDDGDNLSSVHAADDTQVVIKPNGTATIEVTIELNKTLTSTRPGVYEELNAKITVAIDGSHISQEALDFLATDYVWK